MNSWMNLTLNNMEDDGYVPPMSPDDFAALAELAGPLYQQSKLVEAYTSNNPIPNATVDYGSNNIRMGLEQAKRLAQASVTRPQPVFVPPAASQDLGVGVATFVPYPAQQAPVVQYFSKEDSGQLEFQFDVNEQKMTNDLLREISKKLNRVLKVLESQPQENSEILKLNPNVGKNQVQ